MANLKLEHINKIYDNNVQAVFDFNLEIEDKEFIVFVGPSGCGKSTTLRMIAGLEDITSGYLYIDDVLQNDVSPKDRNIAMVFQSYALYPHMTVYDNMAFGLKIKKVDKQDIDKRIREAANILGLTEYLNRKPKALSGGQRQRVALGRAIVRHPKVFLMDEPLSNLDAKLRVQMRSEIIKLHEKVGATTIYVTHDQTEAMTMATKIVVMKDGYIQQIGVPKEVYNHPQNMFVASFLGTPSMNFITGVYGNGWFRSEDFSILLNDSTQEALKEYEQKKVVLGIRPENLYYEDIVSLTYPNAKINLIPDVIELLGQDIIVHGLVGSTNVAAVLNSRYDIKAHEPVELTLDMNKVHFFDTESGIKIG